MFCSLWSVVLYHVLYTSNVTQESHKNFSESEWKTIAWYACWWDCTDSLFLSVEKQKCSLEVRSFPGPCFTTLPLLYSVNTTWIRRTKNRRSGNKTLYIHAEPLIGIRDWTASVACNICMRFSEVHVYQRHYKRGTAIIHTFPFRAWSIMSLCARLHKSICSNVATSALCLITLLIQ